MNRERLRAGSVRATATPDPIKVAQVNAWARLLPAFRSGEVPPGPQREDTQD